MEKRQYQTPLKLNSDKSDWRGEKRSVEIAVMCLLNQVALLKFEEDLRRAGR